MKKIKKWVILCFLLVALAVSCGAEVKGDVTLPLEEFRALVEKERYQAPDFALYNAEYQATVQGDLLLVNARISAAFFTDRALLIPLFQKGVVVDKATVGGATATLSVAGGSRRISVDLLDGYRYTQIYAPHTHDYLAFEPMTAPTNSLVSGKALRLVEPGDTFRAKFRIRVGQDA